MLALSAAAEERPALFYKADRCPPLSAMCEGGKDDRWIRFKPADARFEKNAFTIRFGEDPNKPSKIEVQVGSFLQRAFFIAAVVTTFLL